MLKTSPRERRRANGRCSSVQNEYYDLRIHIPVRINGKLEKELRQKANKILTLQRKGIKLIFPDVLTMERELLDKNRRSVI